jgi:hypothetical protein
MSWSEVRRWRPVETSNQRIAVEKKVSTGPDVEASINERSSAAVSRLTAGVAEAIVSVENGTVVLEVASVTAVIAGKERELRRAVGRSR